jgi:hypothetical protein
VEGEGGVSEAHPFLKTSRAKRIRSSLDLERMPYEKEPDFLPPPSLQDDDVH